MIVKSWKYVCVCVFSHQKCFLTPHSSAFTLPGLLPNSPCQPSPPFSPDILVVYKVVGRGVSKLGRRGGCHWRQVCKHVYSPGCQVDMKDHLLMENVKEDGRAATTQ